MVDGVVIVLDGDFTVMGELTVVTGINGNPTVPSLKVIKPLFVELNCVVLVVFVDVVTKFETLLDVEIEGAVNGDDEDDDGILTTFLVL